jgi:hypothetical protein
MNTDNNPTPPDALPSSIAAEFSQLDDESLRAALDYGQALLNTHTDPASKIEAGPNEEIVSIEDHGTHTTVIKYEDCADGCDECPHGPYLYHVRSEEHINGEENLHWVYIGEVVDECTS